MNRFVREIVSLVLAFLLLLFAVGCADSSGGSSSGSGLLLSGELTSGDGLWSDDVAEIIENEDGTKTVVGKDGSKITVDGDVEKVITNADGTKTIVSKDGSAVTVDKGAEKVVTNPDGSKTAVDGSGNTVSVQSVASVSSNNSSSQASNTSTTLSSSSQASTVSQTSSGASSSSSSTSSLVPPVQNTKIIGDGRQIAVVGEWIYYRNVRDNYKLYKKRADGTGEKKVLDVSCDGFFLIGNSVFYNLKSAPLKKYLIDMDGENNRLISDDINSMKADGDWFYCQNLSKRGLYRMKPDGTQKTQITDFHLTSYDIEGDWIYYTRMVNGGATGTVDYALYKIKIDGSGNQKLFDRVNNGGWCSMVFCVSDDWIYYDEHDAYLSRTQPARVKIDSRSSVKLSDKTGVYDAQILGNTLFFIDANSGHKMFSVKVDGSNERLVTDYKATRFSVFNDYIYCEGYKIEISTGEKQEW